MTEVIKLQIGDIYTAQNECFLINEKHTVADICRWLCKEGIAEDVLFILQNDLNSGEQNARI